MTDALAGDRSDWTTPGVFTVAPGVHRIPLPLPNDSLRAVNVYAIEDDAGLILIDSGWALDDSRQLLEKSLATLGFALGDVRSFLVTHLHRDHYTQAIVLRRLFGSRVFVGSDERASLEAMLADPPRPLDEMLDRLRAGGATHLVDWRLAAGAGSREDTEWERPDDWLTAGELTLSDRSLHVVPTPGHTQGHVVFVDEGNRLIFSGDHVLPHITPSIGFEPVQVRLALLNYLDSLRRVRALPDMRLLPAHGPVGGSVHARIDELLVHHDVRLVAAEHAVRGGAETAFAAANALTWTRRERRLADLDPFNQMLAITETAAHLDLLVARGRLRAQTEEGVVVYASVDSEVSPT